MTKTRQITKTLSANDIGLTGGHQAGILVPKAPEILSFFPTLDAREKNPRLHLMFYEENEATQWEFAFIYYNNALFGGTRNEYRLTRMTHYLRSKNAKVGDDVILTRNVNGRHVVSFQRHSPSVSDGGVLKLTGGWKVISIK